MGNKNTQPEDYASQRIPVIFLGRLDEPLTRAVSKGPVILECPVGPYKGGAKQRAVLTPDEQARIAEAEASRGTLVKGKRYRLFTGTA